MNHNYLTTKPAKGERIKNCLAVVLVVAAIAAGIATYFYEKNLPSIWTESYPMTNIHVRLSGPTIWRNQP